MISVRPLSLSGQFVSAKMIAVRYQVEGLRSMQRKEKSPCSRELLSSIVIGLEGYKVVLCTRSSKNSSHAWPQPLYSCACSLDLSVPSLDDKTRWGHLRIFKDQRGREKRGSDIDKNLSLKILYPDLRLYAFSRHTQRSPCGRQRPSKAYYTY